MREVESKTLETLEVRRDGHEKEWIILQLLRLDIEFPNWNQSMAIAGSD
jgi:hypothetical protein